MGTYKKVEIESEETVGLVWWSQEKGNLADLGWFMNKHPVVLWDFLRCWNPENNQPQVVSGCLEQ